MNVTFKMKIKALQGELDVANKNALTLLDTPYAATQAHWCRRARELTEEIQELEQ